ncbi:MAG: transposase [Pleurocapsa sp. SU_5_0]|nr:transposase [Pleurocapsa sp. SU_5_0]NJR44779.1 transposase [Hyellaceae cyanobacterium CSU_1_1]
MIGVEAKIKDHPALNVLGNQYESIRRTGLNDLQRGMSEIAIEKSYQSRFNLQWAWADAIATEVKQTYSQLSTAKKLNIARITEQIRKKTKRAKSIFKSLSKVKNPTVKQKNQASGLKSKLLKIESLKKQWEQLESSQKLHICFGSKKLFNAQYHLKENGYSNHEEWLHDWRKKRGGRFFCVGKSQHGGGTMIKIFHVNGDDFKAVVTLPRFMQSEHGKTLEIPFQVAECRRRRKSSLLYAIETQKPITVQIFRREHKSDNWYIHLTTYVQEIPVTTSFDNGCIGVDFNRDSVEWAYVLSDGNIKERGKISFKWKGFSSGQRQVMMRNLVVKLSDLAFDYQCPIAIESLDFSKRKASMSEASKAYNLMLSNLSTSTFREALFSRCKRYGIGLHKVNPAFTSVIGMIKFMPRYGLNSGTAAAMTIARRAMGMSERAPQCLVKPEDLARHSWTTWNRVARYLKSNKVRRSKLFDWMKTLEEIVLVGSDAGETDSTPSLASKQSNRQKTGNSPSPDPKYVQLCLGF